MKIFRLLLISFFLFFGVFAFAQTSQTALIQAAKAFDLKQKGYNFRWFIVGGAPETNKDEEALIKRKVYEYSVGDCVTLIGRKTNPYPYLKQSDLLVCLSSSETFNYTMTEAKILGVPIVTTDYACAKESVADHEEGLIVPVEGISDAIERMMTDSVFYNNIRNNLHSYSYDSSHVLGQLYTTVLK